jgi:hypothetical protein
MQMKLSAVNHLLNCTEQIGAKCCSDRTLNPQPGGAGTLDTSAIASIAMCLVDRLNGDFDDTVDSWLQEYAMKRNAEAIEGQSRTDDPSKWTHQHLRTCLKILQTF